MQSNDNLTEVSDAASASLSVVEDHNLMSEDHASDSNIISASDKVENEKSVVESNLSSDSNGDFLKADGQIIYIYNGTTPIGDGSTQDVPTIWSNVQLVSGLTVAFLPGNYTIFSNTAIGVDHVTLKGIGEGVVLIGQNNRFFSVSKDYVTIGHMTFRDAITTSSDGGGAIYWTGNYGNLEYCDFYDNYASKGFGGAIYVKGKYSNVTDCRFYRNRANGGDYGEGGAIAVNNINLTVKNCIFDSNKGMSSSADGGAIAAKNGGDYLVVDNCLFYNNTADVSSTCGGVLSHLFIQVILL